MGLTNQPINYNPSCFDKSNKVKAAVSEAIVLDKAESQSNFLVSANGGFGGFICMVMVDPDSTFG